MWYVVNVDKERHSFTGFECNSQIKAWWWLYLRYMHYVRYRYLALICDTHIKLRVLVKQYITTK